MAEPIELPIPNFEGLELKKVARTGVEIQVPIEIGIVGQELILLEHATMRVRGANVITRRVLAKRGNLGRGSVKELWSTDDYEIAIRGTFKDENADGYPMEMVSRIDTIVKQKRPIRIECKIAYALGISRIVVTSWEYEEPKDGWVNYALTAYSDDEWEL